MPAGSPYPRPLAGPPPWLPLLEPGADGEPADGVDEPIGGHWPQLESLDYLTKLLTLIVLLLALPWLFGKLLHAPGTVPKHAAHMTSVGA